MWKEVVLSIRPSTLAALVVLCAVLTLTACGCSRATTPAEKPAARAADTAAGAAKANAAPAVRVSAEKTEAAEPAAAAGLDGTVYVVWIEHRGREADVWLAHLDGEGKPLGAHARVNPNAGEATAWHGDPPTVAVSREGIVYVGWTARDERVPRAGTLHLSASRDGGRSFGPPAKVNDDRKPGVHGMHSLAVSADGRVYVAWLDERNVEAPKPSAGGPVHAHTESNREVYFASSEDGGRTFSPNRKVASEVCPCCKTSLAVGEDGRVYVGWRQVLPGDFRHVAVASSVDGGQTFSSAAVVSDDRWELKGCPVSGPALAAGGDGFLRVLWYTAGEAGQPGLYWSESHDGGRTFSQSRMLAETGGRGTPTLLTGGGRGLTTVWEGADGDSPALMQTQVGGDGRVTTATIVTGGGELPAAAEAAGQLFVAYITKDGEERGVWMVKVRQSGFTGSVTKIALRQEKS
jgi:hypothetical protein